MAGPTPLALAKNQLLWHYWSSTMFTLWKIQLITTLFKYRCLISAKTVQGNYLNLSCGLNWTLHFSAHLTQDKNKEDRKVRISKAPVLVSAGLVRMWRVCFFLFFFFKVRLFIYPKLQNTKKEPTLIKSNQCIVTLSGKEALCLALKVVGLK